MNEITVRLDADTIAALKAQGYVLYVLQAFETTMAQGRALVWITLQDPGDTVRVTFAAPRQAYVGMAVEGVKLGDIVTFDEDGDLTNTPGGDPKGVTFRNTTKEAQVAGLAIGASSPVPVLAVPLDGLGEDVIVPLNTLLLTFSTAGAQPGGALSHSMTQGLLYRPSGGDAEVSFDINTGWSFGAAPWFHAVPAGEDLSTVLAKQRPLVQA